MVEELASESRHIDEHGEFGVTLSAEASWESEKTKTSVQMVDLRAMS